MPKSRTERAGVREVRQRIATLRKEIDDFVTKRQGLLANQRDLKRRIRAAGGRGRGRPGAGAPAKSRELTDLEKALVVVNKSLEYYSKAQSAALNKIHELERRIIARPRQG